MFYLKKRIEISAAHSLMLDYKTKCERLHGHNWNIIVYCKSETLDENGMVVDFTHIKKKIVDQLDHQNLNEVLSEINPTSENVAKWICEQIPHCYKVTVQETADNEVSYEKDTL